MRNFLTKLRFFKNFDFFTKDVLKHVWRGRETIEKKYWVFYEIWAKKNRPLPIHHPSPITHHPSVKLKKFTGSKKADYHGKIEIKKKFSRVRYPVNIKQKETQRGPLGGPLRVPPPGDKNLDNLMLYWERCYRYTKTFVTVP